jgi:hypothetical protein
VNQRNQNATNLVDDVGHSASQNRVTNGDDEGLRVDSSNVCESTDDRDYYIELLEHVRAVINETHDSVRPTDGYRV